MAHKKNIFIEIARSIILHRRMIIINVFIVSLLAVVISLVLPKWYRAQVTILPPEKSESLSDIALSMGMQSFGLGGGDFALPMMASPSDLLASVARSRTVAERVVDSLDLMKVYDTEKKELAIKELKARMNVNVTSDGIIEITYISRIRDNVAKVTNAIARELDYINRMTKVKKARDLRSFIEEELRKNAVALNAAEKALQEFQKRHKAISLDNQMAASINAAAELYSQLTLDQIRLKVMEKSHSADHPDVIALRYKISEIEKKLRQLQEGGGQATDSATAFLAIPFSELPELNIRYLQLLRGLKKEESLHEVLATQLEQAKIMEAKDTPTIHVLDWAVTPLYKFKPRRAMIGITAFMLSLIISIILAVVYDRWREYKAADPQGYQDISVMMKTLKKDLLGFRQKKG